MLVMVIVLIGQRWCVAVTACWRDRRFNVAVLKFGDADNGPAQKVIDAFDAFLTGLVVDG